MTYGVARDEVLKEDEQLDVVNCRLFYQPGDFSDCCRLVHKDGRRVHRRHPKFCGFGCHGETRK
jgi:hypothetical protein